MPARSTLFAAAVLAASAPELRADVLHVNGPSPDFAQISQAVAAAQDGDVVRVWPGRYQGFTIADEDLRIVRDSSPGIVAVEGVVRVQFLSAGKTVVLSGLDVTAAAGEGLIVFECLGAVRVHACTFTGGNGYVDPPDSHVQGFAGVRVEASADVAFSRCSSRGGIGMGGQLDGAYRGGDGLWVKDARVAFHVGDTTGGIGGGPWGKVSFGDGANGGTGARVDDDAMLFTADGRLEGGRGGNGGEGCPTCELTHGGAGGEGLSVHGATVFALDNTLVPGDGGMPGTYGVAGPDGLELEVGAEARLRELRGRARLLTAPALASDGTSIDLQVHGLPGDEVFLASATATGFRVVPAARGVWLLDGAWPLGPFRLDDPGHAHGTVPTGDASVGIIGPGGTLVVPYPLPALPPGSENATQYFQALVRSAGGRVLLTDLASVVVVDDAP